MKTPAQRKMKMAQTLLTELGVASLKEFMNSFLVLGVSYGNEKAEGETVVIRPERVYLTERSLRVELEQCPVVIEFGDLTPGTATNGEFKDFTSESRVDITQIQFSGKQGWIATYCSTNPSFAGVLDSNYLKVEII